MNVVRYRDKNFAASIERLTASSTLFDPIVEDRTRVILQAVAERGDAALTELTQRFDGASLQPEQLAVTPPELLNASLTVTKGFRTAVAAARGNIERFSRRSLRRSWSMRNAQGGKVGEKFDPFQRVGIYIPGGTAPLVSTALMTICLAKVAGCPEIVVCTPPQRGGALNPALLFAIRTAGATEIYRVGGAQAIAAMAHGTKTIRRVQKVFGPGNAYVVAAKRLLFGRVAVDLLPGPSEVLVLADDTAEPRYVAADLLAQAEHGSGHERVWLVTTSGDLVRKVEKEIAKQLPKLTRREMIERALANNGWLIHVKSIEAAIELANQLAPEHCEIMARGAARLANRLTTAGAVFVGPFSPTVLGDYVAGPSHTLPTGGAGFCFSGLTVDQFQRRTSIVEFTPRALAASVPAVTQFAAMEGLDAHARSATTRLDKQK